MGRESDEDFLLDEIIIFWIYIHLLQHVAYTFLLDSTPVSQMSYPNTHFERVSFCRPKLEIGRHRDQPTYDKLSPVLTNHASSLGTRIKGFLNPPPRENTIEANISLAWIE